MRKYGNVQGQFRLQEWELPMIFRIGISINPIILNNHELTLAMDALYPNNNNESINIGGQYELKIPGTGSFFLRDGYKAIFMEDSEYGLTFGSGIILRFMNNFVVKADYAFKPFGILGNTQSYTLGFLF